MMTNPIVIQDVLYQLMEPVHNRLEKTVDALLSGSGDTVLTGIVTTFLATHHVLQKAVDLGANLVISHEGIFYSHHGRVEYFGDDPVCQHKLQFIEESGLAIFRFHDYLHRYEPDEINEGLVHALGWQAHVKEHQAVSTIVTIPKMTVKDVAEHAKQCLSVPYVRVVGDLNMPCQRIGLLVGYRGGGTLAIPLLEKENLDVVITGEGPEWETPEYVRDAVFQGQHKALLVLGHAASEEPGMKLLAEKLKTLFPTIPVQYISDEPCFQMV